MSKALATKHVAAVLVAAALTIGFAFSFAPVAKADAISDLNAQVQALLAQIAALQGGSSTMSSASCHTFTRNQKSGDTGGEVMWIQQFLNSSADTQVSASGAGSPGHETSYFGPATKAAVIKFQNKYAADILTPVGLTTGNGNWYAGTRAKANALCSGSMTGGTGSTGGTVTPTGPGITVMAATQPANSLAPKNAVRVPFTTFTLVNNTGAAVTINGVTVQRTGLAADADFANLVLVDSNGLQVGNTQTLNSNHMATVGGTFTLAPGASQTFTVAGNIAASPNAGEVASLTVTGINTSVPVAGSLPITGASMTMNNTLVVGSVTTQISSFDPNNASNKNIGSTGIKFTGIRFTAGSGEDLKLYSVRWRINGSASLSDLSNLVTVVNGTSYPTTASADGRYLTSTFPGGILVQKGYSIDAYIQGDLSGSNSAGRVVEFDIDKTSDVYFVGQLYGYGVSMTAGTSAVSTAATHQTAYTSGQPVFQGSTVTVQAGTVTTIQNATSVASQNIPVNVPNTVLGGFQTNFAGEPVTVSGLTIKITSTGTTTTSEITNVSIVDENGAVVAGPVDATASVLSYTNSITFPVGLHTYTIKGKIPSTGWGNGATLQLNTTPSGWSSPTGQTTGNTITISTGNFTMNTMTVRTGSLTVSAASSPASQAVVAGGQNVLFANLQFDASQSGEDMRMSSVAIEETGAATPANLSGCTLWNGSTAVNTGSNVVNTVNKNAVTTFNFDNAVTFPKGTVTTLGLTCNLSSAATSSTYIFGVVQGDFTSTAYTATGKDSGNTFTVTGVTSQSGTMTVASQATVSLNVDASSPSYAVQAAGTTGVTVGVLKLRASNEAFNLTKLGLTLVNGTYGANSTGAGGTPSNGAGDLVQVYLYSGSTLIGTATFTGSNQTATSTLTNPLSIPRDTDTLITVKADLAAIGLSSAGGIGNIIKVDPLNFEGTGAQSGTTVRGYSTAGTSNTNPVAGIRLFKTYPTVALDALPSTGVADGRLIRFKVTANSAGPVGISNFNFTISTTTGTVTLINLYGFTDSSYSQAISGQGTGGLIGNQVAGAVSGTGFNLAPNVNPVQVPAGQTYYFELRGSVSAPTNTSIVTTLNGDAAYGTTLAGAGYNVQTAVAASSTDSKKFVWTGNSTTTASIVGDADFSDGFAIPGLPSSGLSQTRSN